MLPTIAPKLARFLGPKGLMPVAKRGTVREDVAEAIAEARGLLDWKGDKQGHVRAGKFSKVPGIMQVLMQIQPSHAQHSP